MNRRAIRIAALAIFATAGFAVSAYALDPAPTTVVTPIFSSQVTAAGQPIVLPTQDARVVASQYDIPPGASLPVHKHPFPRYAYVAAGELRVTDAETGKSTDYKTGDFIIEMVGRWHQGANLGTEAVKLIVIDLVEGDVGNTVLKQ